MEKRILLFSFVLLSILSAKAQVLVGDMNDDGDLTISDVTESVNTIIGKTAKRYIDAYKVDNTSIVGTWTSASGCVTFNEDGTTDYGTGYTYEYEPNLGRVVFYNSSSIAVKMLNVIKVTTQYIILSPDANTLTYYYKGGQVSGITLSETSITGVIGQTYQLTATVSPSDAAIPALTWSSSNESIATVDATGLVTVKGGGTVTITATATDGSGKTAACTITVPIPVSSITLDKTSLVLDLDDNDSYTLTATVLPANADDTSVTWSSSDEDVAMVSSKGKVMAADYGTATITCTAKDGSGVTATCKVIVSKPHEYVDLGLPSGTKWATCNVGADSPEDYGDYFAWGEITPQTDNTYLWASYKWMTSGQSSWQYVTKYTFADNGTSGCWYSNGTYVGTTVDGVTYTDLRKLEPADDAATANWGSDWCMPTHAQQVELVNDSYTFTKWTTENGVYGSRIYSLTNGNSIFLPAAGYRRSGSLNYAGSSGFYWSSELCSEDSGCAWAPIFDSIGVGESSYGFRYDGRSVRPVRCSASE